MKYTPKLPDASVNVSKNNIVFELLKYLLGSFIFIISIYFSLTFISNIIIENLSPNQEEKILNLLSFDYSKIDDDKKLTAMANKLIKCSDLKQTIHVKILESEEENAFAMLGGNIMVTSQLLKNAKNDSELYFILGHELGHYINKDHLKGMGNAIIAMFLSTFIPTDIDFISNFSFNVSNSSYSKKQELMSDKVGLDLMYCALGNVNSVTSFFERIQSNENKWLYLLGSHPDSQSRIKHLERLIKEKGYN